MSRWLAEARAAALAATAADDAPQKPQKDQKKASAIADAPGRQAFGPSGPFGGDGTAGGARAAPLPPSAISYWLGRARRRPTAWPDHAQRPETGAECACCAGRRWWGDASGWRCGTCRGEPPDGAESLST